MSRKTVTVRVNNMEEWDKFLDKLEKIYDSPRGRGHVGPTLEEFAYDFANDRISRITQESYDELRDENKKQSDKIMALQSQINEGSDESNAKILELKDEISRLKEKLSDFENVSSSVDGYLEDIDRLEKENKDLLHDNKLKDSSISQLNDDNNRLVIENNKLNKDNNDLSNQLDSITSKFKANEDLLKTNSTTITQLKEHNNNLTRTTERLEEENMKQKKEVSAARNDYKHAVNRNNKLQDEVNSLQEESRKYSYVVGQIEKMSLIDRIFKNYPKEIKELESGKNSDDSNFQL